MVVKAKCRADEKRKNWKLSQRVHHVTTQVTLSGESYFSVLLESWWRLKVASEQEDDEDYASMHFVINIDLKRKATTIWQSEL